MSNIKIGDKHISQEELAMLAVAVAMDKKAVRPVIMDLKNIGSFTELFVIVSASNQRQVYAIAEHIRQTFKHCLGLSPMSIDGLESSSWVLIDYGFLFIHVFHEPTRELYQLEQLWSKARLLDVDEGACDILLREVNKISHELNTREIERADSIII